MKIPTETPYLTLINAEGTPSMASLAEFMRQYVNDPSQLFKKVKETQRQQQVRNLELEEILVKKELELQQRQSQSRQSRQTPAREDDDDMQHILFPQHAEKSHRCPDREQLEARISDLRVEIDKRLAAMQEKLTVQSLQMEDSLAEKSKELFQLQDHNDMLILDTLGDYAVVEARVSELELHIARHERKMDEMKSLMSQTEEDISRWEIKTRQDMKSLVHKLVSKRLNNELKRLQDAG